MNIRRIIVLVVCATSLYGKTPAQPANIIFDMNGVLTEASIAHTLWNIGPSHFVGLFNPLQIQETYFNFLARIKPRDAATPGAYHRNKYLLPQIMCDWLMGTIDSQSLLRIINNGLDEIAYMIDSQRKVKLVRSMAGFMFDPEKLASVISRINKGYKLFKKCAREVDEHGKRVHKLFIITNWDAESWPLLMNNPKIARMLEMADGIIVSGYVHMMKPDPAIFEFAFSEWGIDPEHEFTVYIDDEQANISGAQSLEKEKLLCLLCTGDYKAIRKELKRYRVLHSNH